MKERKREGKRRTPPVLHSDQPSTSSLLTCPSKLTPPGSQPSAATGIRVGRMQHEFCQRLETVTFISQKALGDNLGCNGRNSGSFATEIPPEGMEKRKHWISDVPISLLTGTPTTG